MPPRSLASLAAAAALAAALGPAAACARAAAPDAAAAVAPMTAAERASTVEDLAKTLEDYFVFPDVGAKYAARLRERLAAGAYDALSDPDAFSWQATHDLMQVSKDGHLRLQTEAKWGVSRSGPPPASAPAAGAAKPSAPKGLEDARRIGDVAYLRFNEFVETPEQAKAVSDFLRANADAGAVVIDMRPHRGGGLLVMDAILPLLFENDATLVRMETRAAAAAAGGGMPPYASIVSREGPPTVVRSDHVVRPDATETRLRDKPVYLLTAKRTASAAEHFALALKRTGRAVLIGETTNGAGHYGGLRPIGERFAAFVPVGRTYDPDTGEGWEGTGLAPDVPVPADQALEEALKRLRAAGVRTE